MLRFTRNLLNCLECRVERLEQDGIGAIQILILPLILLLIIIIIIKGLR